MKKFLKIFLISLGSLVLLLAIVVSVALWIVFTPERLTPIVRNQVGKFITCESEIGSVELTFFSSFPKFELKIDRLALVNKDAQTACGDTLLRVETVQAGVDVQAFLRNSELLLSGIRLSDGLICAYVDKSGRANYDIFPADDTAETDTASTGLPFGLIDVPLVVLNNVDITYVDETSGMKASVEGFSADLGVALKMPDDIRLQMNVRPFRLTYADDSLQVKADIRDFSPAITASLLSDDVHADLRVSPFKLSVDYAGETYLNDVALGLDVLADVNLSRQAVRLDNLAFSLNGMSVALSGSALNDTLTGDIHTDLSYKLDSWSIEDLLALVPASFQHYLAGITAGGLVSSWGTVKGVYNDSVMPLLDVHVSLADARVEYPEMLPFPVRNVNGNVSVYTDLADDVVSYVQVDNFSLQTPKSSLRTAGRVKSLFSDMHVDLTTDASLHLPEFASFLPEDMNMAVSGNVSGRIKTDVSLSQIEKMALDQMKISGQLACKDLAVVYDTISMRTDLTKIDFDLPNRKARTQHTGFVSAGIQSESLDVKMGGNMSASLQGTALSLETSDVRDTTKIPALHLELKSGLVQARMDDMGMSIEQPGVWVSVAPQRRNADQPRFSVSLNSGKLNAHMAQEQVMADKLDVKATVSYNKNQKDIFLQWMPRGVFDLQNAQVATTMVPYPVEIPRVKMDFTPRTFTIENAGVKLGDSDFNLSGKLTNILPYFRGDSILRGDFAFVSDHTDIDQLMNLTNGLGTDDTEESVVEVAEVATETVAEPVSTGPYMVPKGMDITLHTNIKEASLGENSITKINGDVRVSDGILLLDDLTLSIPGSDMQLSAMYETPRKNHLFVGLDFHLLEIEISDLLGMIPELDTIMPMLRSFSGKGEFHIIAETNLDSMYNPKYSTMLGAASIRGIDLVVLDGDMFSKIAKILRFNKQTENRVDSLMAEFTMFQEEIDVYPFLLAMDKYKVVVGGRHNLDMSFDYNVSLVESPLPFRVSVDINPKNKWWVKPAKAKYPDFYRPVSRHAVQTQEMQYRQRVRNALLKQVVKKEENE